MDPQEVHDVVERAGTAPEVRRAYQPVDMANPAGLVMREPIAELVRRQTTTTTGDTPSETCPAGSTDPICAKPIGASTYTLPIAFGVTIPVVAIIVTLLYLHRRHVRKQRAEDAADRHASLDFGMGEVHRQKGKEGRKGRTVGGPEYDSEKRPRQVSIDLNTPYLLPPEIQNSRESLHSLSKTLHSNEDPYRPVSQYSTRSQPRPGHETSSNYTKSSEPYSRAPSRLQESASAGLISNAARMSRSGPPSGSQPPRQNSLPSHSDRIDPYQNPAPPYSSQQNSPVDASAMQLPQPPAPVAQAIPRKGLATGLPQNPRPMVDPVALPTAAADDNRVSYAGKDHAGFRRSNNYLGQYIHREASPAPAQATRSVKTPEPEPISASTLAPVPAESAREAVEPVVVEVPNAYREVPARKSPPQAKNLPVNPRPVRKQSLPLAQQTHVEDASNHGDDLKVTPSPHHEPHDQRHLGNPQSTNLRSEGLAQAGLGAPTPDTRRLSMGLRPLPPNAATESDDPEIRANRIRSFYKEYFDESKPAPKGQYYEDYDENYLGDAAYYDSRANNFVMPYAQPVTRRAMTPPPSGQRFMGLPSRAFHGSMSGMPSPRAFHGSMVGMPPRANHGSMVNLPPPRFPSSSRPSSSGSGARSFSASPGRSGSPRGRPLPPPMDLTSLPTPSKLRDDSFALTGAIDFAPPISYKDRQAGRSQSPLGERRPYSPSVPSHRPLASAFEELAPMPSPHLLRSSGTFTALDFAPPRKFRDQDDVMSDAGSIRSARSGVSQRTNEAIRRGAYRVSRLPGDTVFVKDDLAAQLKPNWTMRNNVV